MLHLFDMKSCFSQEKRSYYERFRLIPNVAIEHDENKMIYLNQCLTEKQDHVCLYQRTLMVN